MQIPDFEKFYEEQIYKKHDIVSKKECRILWDRFLVLRGLEVISFGLQDIYALIKDEGNLWMNFTKFYRKRNIALKTCEALLPDKTKKNVSDKISEFTIRDFYGCIDYKRISYGSLEDVLNHIKTTGETYREKLTKEIASRKFATRDRSKKSGDYSYCVICALVYFLWNGYTIEDILSMKIGESGLPVTKSGKEIQIPESCGGDQIFETENLQERISVVGMKIPIVHNGYVFWEGLTKQTALDILREFNRISDRELSTSSISRSVLFCHIKNGDLLKEKLNPAEAAEYDSWLKAFR